MFLNQKFRLIQWVKSNKQFETLKGKDVSAEMRRFFKNIYKETKIKMRIRNKLLSEEFGRDTRSFYLDIN